MLESGGPGFLAKGVHCEANRRASQGRRRIFQESVFLHSSFNKVVGEANNTVSELPASKRVDSGLEVASEEVLLGDGSHVESEGIEEV